MVVGAFKSPTLKVSALAELWIVFDLRAKLQ